MLTAIRVGNFKAFAESQRIPLRPITLIYGANSSGKSSILHSLIFACHAEETRQLDLHRTTVGGESVDLGGFRQFIHRRDVNRRMEWSAELDTAKFTGRLAELLAPVKYVAATVEIGLPQVEEMKEQESIDSRTGDRIRIRIPTGNLLSTGDPELMSYTLTGDGKPLMQMSRRRDGKLQLDRLDHEHPVFREVIRAIVETSTTTASVQPSDFEGLGDAISEIVPEITVVLGKFLPEGLTRLEGVTPGGETPLFPVSRGRRREDLAAAIRFFIPRTLDDLIVGIKRAISEELARVRYLGPLRSYPPRHLAFSQYHDPNWYAGGGYAWDFVRKDPQVRKQVNAWLSAPGRLQTPYELQIRHLLTIDDLYSDFGTAVTEIEDKFVGAGKYEGVEFRGDLFGEEIPSALDKLKENESKLSNVHELILVDGRSNTIVSHRDVGIGVSQVLPVLVGAYASQNQIVAIEQPEIHLHPGLQADLGDLFIQSTLAGGRNRFLIETHSEHLLLRVMRRIRETNNHSLPDGAPEITPEDVCVLFVEPDGTRSIVREMPLNENGELVKAWPGGFFEEGLREVF